MSLAHRGTIPHRHLDSVGEQTTIKLNVTAQCSTPNERQLQIRFDWTLGMGRYTYLPIRYYHDTWVPIRYVLRFYLLIFLD